MSRDAASTARSWLRSAIDHSHSLRLPSPPAIYPRQGRFGLCAQYICIINCSHSQHQLHRSRSRVRLGLGAEPASETEQHSDMSHKLVRRKIKRQLKKSTQQVESEDAEEAGWPTGGLLFVYIIYVLLLYLTSLVHTAHRN